MVKYILLFLVWLLPLPVHGVVIDTLLDPLNDVSHFISSELLLTPNGDGTLDMTHTNTAPPSDETALWGKTGPDVHIALTGGSMLQVVPTASISSGTATGTWGFDVLWFDATDSYISQINYQSFTNLTGVQTYFITSSVPVGAVSWVPQFRVFDQTGDQPLTPGYGFTFDSISASQVPEPSVLGLGLIGGTVGWAVNRKRKLARKSRRKVGRPSPPGEPT